MPAYDGLRFALLLGVMEFHYLMNHVPTRQFWFLSYCLCCFFVLSGFLITHLLVSDSRPGFLQRCLRFYWRRSLRVFPAYYVVLLTAALTLGVPFLGWHLVYLFNWKFYAISAAPNKHELLVYMRTWDHNGLHLWSMGVEEQFYLLYAPFLLALPGRWRTPALSLGLVGCVALRLLLSHGDPHSCYGTLLPVAGEYILWGCLLAWLDWQGRIPWLGGPVAFHTSLLALGALFFLDSDLDRYDFAQMRPPDHQTLYAVALAVFILGLKHQPRHPLSRFLSLSWMTRLGKISYGTYLVHLFLNPVVDQMIQAQPWLAPFPVAPRAVLGPLLSLLVAALMWVTFEGRLNRVKTP